MPAIESAYVYLFDCFPKSKDPTEIKDEYEKKWLELYNLTGVKPKIYEPAGSGGHTVDEITMTYKERQSIWEIKDLEVLLEKAEKVYNGSEWNKDSALTKKMIKLLNIFWIDNDTFPFYSLTFCLTVQTNGIEPQEIMNTVQNAARPIRALFDTFHGITTQLVTETPYTISGLLRPTVF